MRILHLLSQHPQSTGSGIYVGQVMRMAAAAGHVNALVAGVTGDMDPRLEGLAPELRRYVRFASSPLDFPIPGMSDVMPYASSRFSGLNPAQLAAYREAFAAALADMVETFRPEIIHSHHLWLLTALARERCVDIPMVASCHSTDLRQFRQCPQYRQLVTPACRRLQRVLALGPSQRQEIVSLHGIGEGRIDIVGAGFDEELFTWGEKAPPPPVELLYAGKLSLAKGVDILLGAFAGLAASDLHLHLAGSAAGPEGELCRGLAAQCGSAVTLHGPLDQRQLARLMRRCHIFVLPSFAEGLPLVVLEALASGCRLLVSDLPGCREALQGFDPRRVAFLQLPPLGADGRPEPADMAALQGRLAALIERMARGAGEESQASGEEEAGIVAGYGWRAVFARIERSYARAVAG